MRRFALVLAAACTTGAPHRFASPMLGGADVPTERLPAEAPLPAPAAHVATIGPTPCDACDPASYPWHALPDRRHADAEPALHHVEDLRLLVGRRDKRDGFAAAMAWSQALGGPHADSIGELRGDRKTPAPGNLLVFARTESDDADDLVAIAVATDARGVTEFVYLAGGIVRRGFLDVARPSMRRDADGAVVNTYLRAGKRWPPKGTHYLAGELLARVI